MVQMPLLRRSMKADDMPALYKQAFERELDRIILSQFQEPGRVDDHLAFNRHYARYFSLLATEPQLLDASMESHQELVARGLGENDADALAAIASRHKHQRPISPGQLADDLRVQGIEPSERNLAAGARIAATAYRNANIEACEELGSPLPAGDVWPLPKHLERLAHAEAVPAVLAPVQPAKEALEEAPAATNEGSPPFVAPPLSVYAKEALRKKITHGAWDKGRKRDIEGAVRIFIAANGDIPVNAITRSTSSA